MKALNFLLLTLVATLLGACSFDKNQSDDKNIRDRNELKERYIQVSGYYRGNLTTNDSSVVPVELFITTGEKEDGISDDGRKRYRPTLDAMFRRVDIAGVNVKLPDGTYAAQNNELVFTDGTNTINAQVSGDQIIGEVKVNRGVWGKFTVNLISKQVEAPSEGDENETNERLKEMYNQVVGTYSGQVQTDPRQAEPFGITVELFIGYEQTTTGLMPVLKGYYRRTADNSSDLDLILKVDYKASAIPKKLNIISTGLARGGQTNYQIFLDLAVDLERKTLTGTFSDQRNLSGPVQLRKN